MQSIALVDKYRPSRGGGALLGAFLRNGTMHPERCGVHINDAFRSDLSTKRERCECAIVCKPSLAHDSKVFFFADILYLWRLRQESVCGGILILLKIVAINVAQSGSFPRSNNTASRSSPSHENDRRVVAFLNPAQRKNDAFLAKHIHVSGKGGFRPDS